MRYTYITASLLAILPISEAAAQAMSSAPKLVVNITIDQLRSDYLEAFAPLYGKDGFKKLLSDGKVFTDPSYPFAHPDCASAVAAIVTGTSPYYNGIVGNRWLNRETLRPIFCVDDDKYNGLTTREKSSPKNLTTSTIGDELKVSTNGKALVYAIAPFREAAILEAGHAADGAYWINDESGYWCSTSYFQNSVPSWLSAFNSVYSPSVKIKSLVWQPENELSGNFSYFGGGGMNKPFSHKFSGTKRFREYKTSGCVNEDVTELALQCVSSNGMGIDNTTDMLSITYYGGNFNHKTVTEYPMEIQDTYVRLDRDIAKIVSTLEKSIGLNNVLFVITSTGYSDEESANYEKYRVPSGTFYINRTTNLLNLYFGAIYGQGNYVESCFRNEIFLNHKLFEQKRVNFVDALDRAHEFLLQAAGVNDVYTSQRLLLGGGTDINKIRNGYNPNCSGDIFVVTAPGWRLVNEDSQEDYLTRASFTQFPIIFYGAGTTGEKISTPVTIDRIAPTIAKSIRIRAPNACSSEPLF